MGTEELARLGTALSGEQMAALLGGQLRAAANTEPLIAAG